MADFCRACSVEMFGRDFGELAGLTTEAHLAAGEAAEVICEGCGPIQVDPRGVCLTRTCLHAGQPGHGGLPDPTPMPPGPNDPPGTPPGRDPVV